MTLTIDLPDEKQAALDATARSQGLSVEVYARQVLERALDAALHKPAAGPPELPVFHLGPMGSLRRRDIYRDVR